MPLKRLALVLALGGALTACEEDGTPAGPGGPLEPLPAGTWYLHTIDDSTVSATAASRIIGVATEVTIVDSARLEVGSDGTYSQRYWSRVLVTDNLDRRETIIDFGTWAIAGASYAFTSDVRERSFLVTPAIGDRLLTAEAFATYVGAPTNDGVYRRTRP